jgi:hypothetical protein
MDDVAVLELRLEEALHAEIGCPQREDPRWRLHSRTYGPRGWSLTVMRAVLNGTHTSWLERAEGGGVALLVAPAGSEETLRPGESTLPVDGIRAEFSPSGLERVVHNIVIRAWEDTPWKLVGVNEIRYADGVPIEFTHRFWKMRRFGGRMRETAVYQHVFCPDV